MIYIQLLLSHMQMCNEHSKGQICDCSDNVIHCFCKYVSNSCLPSMPRFFPTCIKLLPFCWFNLDTMVSAGCETTAQKTPAAEHKTHNNIKPNDTYSS